MTPEEIASNTYDLRTTTAHGFTLLEPHVLDSIKLDQCELYDVEIKEQSLRLASLWSTTLRRLTVSDTDATSADFSDGKLTNVRLLHSNLSGVKFGNAALSHPLIS
jgi:uncharacterized protein YjbI with pentapeptide repeats